MFDDIWPRELAIVQDASTGAGWVTYVTGLGLWTRVFGEGLQAQRASSWLCGVAALALAFVVAGRLAGPAAGWWAAGLLATRYMFLGAARVVRPEAALALVVLAAFALWLRAMEGSRLAATLAGVAAGVAPGFHWNGWLLAPALLALAVVARPGWRIGFCLLLGWFVATLVLVSRMEIVNVAAGWTWFEHRMRNPPAAVSLWRSLLGTFVEPFALLAGGLPMQVPREPALRTVTALELAAVYPALWVAWRREGASQRGARHLVILTVALFLASSCFEGRKVGWYLIPYYPLMAVALGLMAAETQTRMGEAFRRPGGPFRRLADAGAVLLGVALIGIGLASAGVAVRSAMRVLSTRPSQASLAAEVRAAVPDGARVFGPHWLWFTLRDHDYRDSTALMETGWWRRGRMEDHLGRFRPDVIIADDGLRGTFFQRHLPGVTGRLDLRPELTRPHRLVARVQGGWPYGMVEVFLVRWK